MGDHLQEATDSETGDKIRIRRGDSTGERGIIVRIVDDLLDVELTSGVVVSVPRSDTTNYSLAARRAWEAMPKRAGRPKSEGPRKRMVSMRIEVDLWDRLGQAVNLGFIPSREEAVNSWLREHLAKIFVQYNADSDSKD